MSRLLCVVELRRGKFTKRIFKNLMTFKSRILKIVRRVFLFKQLRFKTVKNGLFIFLRTLFYFLRLFYFRVKPRKKVLTSFDLLFYLFQGFKNY